MQREKNRDLTQLVNRFIWNIGIVKDEALGHLVSIHAAVKIIWISNSFGAGRFGLLYSSRTQLNKYYPKGSDGRPVVLQSGSSLNVT